MADPAATDKAGLATIAVAVLAIVCCVAGPLVVAVAGSLTVGAGLGVLAGTFMLVAACAAALYVRHRGRTGRGRGQ